MLSIKNYEPENIWPIFEIEGNKKNVKKVEKALKYELRRCDVEVMDKIAKIAKDLEDAAIQHIRKISCGHVNKLRESSKSGPVPVKDKSLQTIISDKE